MCIGGSEATHVERGTLRGLRLERVLFDWIDDWGHLQMFLLAEAEDFSLRRYVHFDLLGGFDPG